jgi:dTMP kinase
MEQKELAFHERMRTGYLEMAAREPERWVIVDATCALDAVQAAIREAVIARQPLKARTQEGKTE